MNFDVNDPYLYILSAIVIGIVLAQSVFFLLKSVKRAKELGITKETINNTIISSSLFSIAPAVSILIGVITLSKFLGLPFPWLRLSILGAVTYELPAATIAANAMGVGVTETITDPEVFSIIAWTMTLGIIAGILMILFGLKKIQKGLITITGKDEKWRAIVMDSLFLGMISAFIGLLFADIREGVHGFIPLVIALCSALLMVLCGILIKKYKISWLKQYALPLCMLGAMALAIPVSFLMSR